MYVLRILTLLLIISSSASFKILAIFPHIGKSHFDAFQHLFRTLAARGHKLTMVSHFPQADVMDNYYDISLAGSMTVRKDVVDLTYQNRRQKKFGFIQHVADTNFLFDLALKNCDFLLNWPTVKELHRYNKTFDLVLVEVFNSDCALGYVHKFKAPFVGLSSHILVPWAFDRLGSPDNPSYVQNFFLKNGHNMSFLQRVENLVFGLFYKIFYRVKVQMAEQELLKKHFHDLPPLNDIAKNISLIVSNTHLPLTGSIPKTSNLIEAGGFSVGTAKHLEYYRLYQHAIRFGAIIEMAFLFSCMFFYELFVCASAYNYLGIFSHWGASHHALVEPVIRDLATRGHNVTAITHLPILHAPDSYVEISLYGTVPILKNLFTFDVHIADNFIRQFGEANMLLEYGRKGCELVASNNELKKILKGTRKFDAVIGTQFNNDCAVAYAYFLNIPFIGISTDTFFPWMFGRLGIPDNPSYVPNHNLMYGHHPNFIQRVESIIVGIHNRWSWYLQFQRSGEKILRKHFGEELPPLETMARKVMCLMLTNSYTALHGVQPLPPNAVQIGGAHIGEVKGLPSDLEKFVSGATHGVIYVSFGSMVKASSMPKDKLDAFLGAFAELPQRVLWKWENETLPGAPPNLLTKKWMPQLDILSHKNVKVFISHGGMLGTTEAIHTGVPMLTIPLFGDQFANAASVRESGLGLILQFEDITKENILKSIKSLLEPKMYANAKRLSQIWHDRPMSPMDTAIYWIEYVARYGGAPHLRSAAVDLPLYQYLLLDVLAFLGAIVAVTLYVEYKIVKFLYRMYVNYKKAPTPVKAKNKKPKKE